VRIGLDATFVRPDRLTGIDRYALELTRGLAALAPSEIVLFLRPDAPAPIASLAVDVRRAPFAWPLQLDQAWLPWAAARAGVDLLHSLAFPTPLAWRGRSAVTVHDAAPWLHPEAVSVEMRFYHRPLFPQALARAEAIFTATQATRDDLVRAAAAPRERIHVTPNGVDERFFRARAPEGPRAPYLLAVGRLEPRKNLGTLLEAFRLLRKDGRDLELALVGRKGWTDSLPVGDLAPYVRFLGATADEDLPGVYAGAACFVIPSLHEGFGIALAEAMAAGVPAVASDIPALREVGGETVRYADPHDPASFAAAVREALDDRQGSQLRAAAARGRARRFRWDACAQATLAVYRALAKARR
jgi:glycosyltransferase involved in cell wall biosynthesis